MRLQRSDLRQRTDRPTNSIVLEYAGRRLQFHTYLYGLPEGTFFHVELDDIEFPEHLEDLAEQACVSFDALPDAIALRKAIADALAAGAMVDAPLHLAEIAEPETEWSEYDRLDLERRHKIAESRVAELVRLAESALKSRIAALRCVGVAPMPTPTVAVVPPPPPPMASWSQPEPTLPAPAAAPRALPVAPELEPEPETETDDDGEDDEERLDPKSKTVRGACLAAEMALELELPQRLPAGTRRRLRQMPAGAYIAYGDAMDVRADLCGAMTDARAMARKDKAAAVIQWNGEWPVVVRRYGQAGRTVYKVEAALRRYTKEHALKTAWARFKAGVQKAISGEAAA